MPRFGLDELLTKGQIAAVVEYVLQISKQDHDAALAAKGQAVFVTDDEFLTVRSWYAARMQIGPASTQNVIGSDCSLLTQSDVLWRAEHTVAVVICATPYGTQVVVNEKLEFWH